MKKFKFRFEKILTHRQYVEKEKQRELAATVDLEMKQQGKLKDLASDRDRYLQKERELLVGRLEPDRLKEFTRYFLLLKKLEISGREVLAEISREVEKKREELIKATVQKKIYEKLKEKHKARYNLEINRYLQKESDEVASRRR